MRPWPCVRSLAVVGTGLIGASAALAARRAGVERVVRLGSRSRRTSRVAAERGAVEPAGDLAEAVDGADLVLVAVPVAELPAAVREVLDARARTAPSRTSARRRARSAPPLRATTRFVGGHPICGAETRGPERATAELFEGATWFLTPIAATEPDGFRGCTASSPRSARGPSRSTRTRTTGSSR